MSLKRLARVKENDRGFKIWDLVVYGVLAVIIAAIFIAVFATSKNVPVDGIKITESGVSVFEFDYSENKYTVIKESAIEITLDSDDRLELTYRTPDGKGFNKIVIDKKKRSIKVTDANCSYSKDCIHCPALTESSLIKYITCQPHKMTIEPLVVIDEDTVIM